MIPTPANGIVRYHWPGAGYCLDDSRAAGRLSARKGEKSFALFSPY